MIYDIAKKMIEDMNLNSVERIEAEKLLLQLNPDEPKYDNESDDREILQGLIDKITIQPRGSII